jgi:hypothetical protein
MTMTDKKELKIEFAPGAFDQFEGTQEELDELMNEITKMFEGKTSEEIKAMSNPISDEDFDELPEDVQLQIMRSTTDSEDIAGNFKRNLQ